MSLREHLVELDRAHVWRPYTSSVTQQTEDPLVIDRAQGVWLHDVDGTRYLDANGSWWVQALGHNHPRIVRAIAEQSPSLLHCSMAGTTHEHAARLAKELIDVAPPGLQRVFYSDNGSTAVEVALKIAFQYWQQNGKPRKTKFLSLGGAFHGDTVGCMSVGGLSLFRKAFAPLLFDVLQVAPPTFAAVGDADEGAYSDDTSNPTCDPTCDPAYDEAWGALFAQLEQVIDTHRAELAAVIVEPLIQGAAGMHMWRPHHLARLREVTEQAGVLLIADEVFVGYGRTGRMWACDHAGISPDLMCLAKAFSGGAFPMAATLATERVFEGFSGDIHRALMHGHTFCGNPLGARLAREVLAIYRDERIVDHVARLAPRVREAFAQLAPLKGVQRVRSMGLVAAADLGAGGYTGRAGWRVYEAARRRGVYLRPLGDTVYICPALTIGDDELELLLTTVRECIAEVAAEPRHPCP
jgi:adenosylmethionine-8-amino-7-oxononanoate aminotransferase